MSKDIAIIPIAFSQQYFAIFEVCNKSSVDWIKSAQWGEKQAVTIIESLSKSDDEKMTLLLYLAKHSTHLGSDKEILHEALEGHVVEKFFSDSVGG